MLEVQDNAEKRLEDARAFAKEHGLEESLEKQLDYLDTYAEHGDRGATKCVLGPDFAPHSFSFLMMKKRDGEYRPWFNGGLIFHPAGSSGVNGEMSVRLGDCSESEWRVHT